MKPIRIEIVGVRKFNVRIGIGELLIRLINKFINLLKFFVLI